MQPVRKAVLPAAGLGTRFLPVTKSIPKEMLPLVDKPAIQYVVEEAVQAGISDVLVITGRGKGAIEDHFDRNVELEQVLERSGKTAILEEVQATDRLAHVHFIRQHEALGLGHAVAVAEPHVGGEPFVVMLGDDIMVDDATLLTRMLDVHAETGGSVLALMEVTPEEISAYGALTGEPVREGVMRARGVVEKPKPEEAPSNLAVIGRYVFTPGIFDALRETEPGVGGEIQLTDAIGILLEREPVFGVVFSEGRYDAGKKVDFLRANIELGLARDDLRDEIEQMLRTLVRARGLT
ncbi:MAG: UTP--glucose-1-phosphate uridylyltransferase GalU [Actinobacteria bacterium]|nr:UTP--glucose-1-phosphate uridylyltransferase GalU [Actinomycetota bacterium]